MGFADNCLNIWDLSVTKHDPIFVQKMPDPDQKCSDIAFTSDGKHLCVSDIRGKIMVYVLSNISTPDEKNEQCNLVYAIAKILYVRQNMTNMLKERKEYAEAFIRLDYEKYGRAYS